MSIGKEQIAIIIKPKKIRQKSKMNVENKGEGIKLSMSMISLNMRTEFSD